jgi:hypothetical protein
MDGNRQKPLKSGIVEADRVATRKGLKRYGLLSVALIVGNVFIARIVPDLLSSPWIKASVKVIFACVFAPALFYGGRFVWDLLGGSVRRN